ncbi:MAG: hypothetical protein SPL86_10845 [Succiniclasticum sp.]|uniref:hypothetical protein n=1 Tax=Succiniclasticum sp. TaxID=2775030 RepID=UPI002A90A0F4|nr:hypothetical protein [Succiniclasticum sp.]MBR1493642.1 hypothetical protein [Acidaminococcaceae bacterium]MDY6291966.1 hypothetical protein [Succiniclasticum sp.]
MAELRVLPPAARFFKKLKDKKLKSLYREVIDKIKASSVICFVKISASVTITPFWGWTQWQISRTDTLKCWNEV